MIIKWLLDGDDLGLPSAYAKLVTQVFRLRCTYRPSIIASALSWVADWDLRRARATRAGSDCLERDIDDLAALSNDAHDPATVWVCSGTLLTAVELRQMHVGPVYWLASDGEGATGRRRGHQSWKSGAPTLLVTLAEVGTDGSLSHVSTRECRVHRTSPGISQLDALITGTATVRVLAAGRTEPLSTAGVDNNGAPVPVRQPGAAPAIERASIGWTISARTALRRVFAPRNVVDHWRVAVAAISTGDDGGCVPTIPSAESFHWLSAPDDRFLADPILAEVAGRPVLFFEQLLFSGRRTSLNAVEIAPDGKPCGPSVVVLERPFHLSFPVVFSDPGEPGRIFMLPEQARSGQTVLYSSPSAGRLEQLKFEQDTVLLEDFPGIDPVLFRKGDCWYLFVAEGRDSNNDNNLQLFVSADLRGPYKQHPMSPIHLGLRGSRMAGPLLRDGDRLIRPAQDCAPRYGAGLVFFNIDDLTESTYHETELFSVGPEEVAPGAIGVHTYSRLFGFVAIDRLEPKHAAKNP